jgi:hypothetical protein
MLISTSDVTSGSGSLQLWRRGMGREGRRGWGKRKGRRLRDRERKEGGRGWGEKRKGGG